MGGFALSTKKLFNQWTWYKDTAVIEEKISGIGDTGYGYRHRIHRAFMGANLQYHPVTNFDPKELRKSLRGAPWELKRNSQARERGSEGASEA